MLYTLLESQAMYLFVGCYLAAVQDLKILRSLSYTFQARRSILQVRAERRTRALAVGHYDRLDLRDEIDLLIGMANSLLLPNNNESEPS